VRIAPKHGKAPGRIEIEYYDDNDLSEVARMLIVAGAAYDKRQVAKTFRKQESSLGQAGIRD
jgi:hypothetical protein